MKNLTFEEWWNNDGSKMFQTEAKEAARYAWNSALREATRLLNESFKIK